MQKLKYEKIKLSYFGIEIFKNLKLKVSLNSAGGV